MSLIVAAANFTRSLDAPVNGANGKTPDDGSAAGYFELQAADHPSPAINATILGPASTGNSHLAIVPSCKLVTSP